MRPTNLNWPGPTPIKELAIWPIFVGRRSISDRIELLVVWPRSNVKMNLQVTDTWAGNGVILAGPQETVLEPPPTKGTAADRDAMVAAAIHESAKEAVSHRNNYLQNRQRWAFPWMSHRNPTSLCCQEWMHRLMTALFRMIQHQRAPEMRMMHPCSWWSNE